ncbi:hypothetical protein Hte_011495 [Hypoxylon texense]
MGLVDYSDSESDSEPVAQPAPAPTPAPTPTVATTATGKKPFQKIIDRSQPGKIRVSLPQTTSGPSKATDGGEEGEDRPPAKRARVGAGGGGAFSGFNSFLPPPKNTRKPVAATASGSGSGKAAAPRPGINLKTGAAPGFSREADEDGEGGGNETRINGGDAAEPPTKKPSIPAEQKPADEVKLVGKPLMFKPLSVSRKPGKKSAAKAVSKGAVTPSPSLAPAAQTSDTSKAKREAEAAAGPPPPKKQKISLFSLPPDDEPAAEEPTPDNNGVYEPMFGSNEELDEFAAYDQQFASANASASAPPNPTAHTSSTTSSSSLDAVAASLNLSAAARRELFGRSGAPSASSSSSSSITTQNVITFDTAAEYAHNEALRASGQAQRQPAFNPLRSLAPGKHSLRQLVTQAQSHKEALEDSFAQGKSHRGEAGARYGWR